MLRNSNEHCLIGRVLCPSVTVLYLVTISSFHRVTLRTEDGARSALVAFSNSSGGPLFDWITGATPNHRRRAGVGKQTDQHAAHRAQHVLPGPAAAAFTAPGGKLQRENRGSSTW